MRAWATFFTEPVPYEAALTWQLRAHALRALGVIPDIVFFLEHTPVITVGTRGRPDHILASPEELAKRGIAVHRTTRGGDVTYHGPGQVVMYPILRLGVRQADTHSYLFNLEEIAIRTASDFSVRAFRRAGLNGAWTDAGKIAAIGFRIKRGVTLHGMSFNVRPDMSHFSLIVPCGLHGEPVCSLKDLLGERCPTIEQVRDRMRYHFEAVCGRELELVSPTVLGQRLAELATEAARGG